MDFARGRSRRQGGVDADSRADQLAGPGTADRRVVQQVGITNGEERITKRAFVFVICSWLFAAALQQLVRPAASERGSQQQVWRLVCQPVRERNVRYVERFSTSEAPRIRARNADRSLRPLLRA